MSKHIQRQQGFTLLEIMIALTIFAVISTLAWQILDGAMRTSNATDVDATGCATMGQKLVVRPGAEIVVSIALRDPAGTNYAPYSFPNPSLLQVGINRPINSPCWTTST